MKTLLAAVTIFILCQNQVSYICLRQYFSILSLFILIIISNIETDCHVAMTAENNPQWRSISSKMGYVNAKDIESSIKSYMKFKP